LTVAIPVLPPADTRIEAEPTATPATTPDGEIVAIALFDELHVSVAADPGGFAVAVSRTVDPAITVAVEGNTEIDFTLLSEPPLASDASHLRLAEGAFESAHAAYARATPVTTEAVAAYTMAPFCITSHW